MLYTTCIEIFLNLHKPEMFEDLSIKRALPNNLNAFKVFQHTLNITYYFLNGFIPLADKTIRNVKDKSYDTVIRTIGGTGA